MSRFIGVLVLLFLALLLLGIIVPAVFKARADEEMRRCQNHLRQIGLIGMFHSVLPNKSVPTKDQSYFPTGTIVNPDLAFERRMSWYVLILSAVELGVPNDDVQKRENEIQKKSSANVELLKGIDVQKSWDAEVNQSLARKQINVLLCPSVIPTVAEGQNTLTNYVGNGGLGANTPSLPLDVAGANAGVFRYDYQTRIEDIQKGDGLSTSISVLETNDKLGPWLQGGPSSVRTLDTDKPPYLGPNEPFSGCHFGKGNFAFADGSVQVLTDAMNPSVFRALLTIRGNEKNEDFLDR